MRVLILALLAPALAGCLGAGEPVEPLALPSLPQAPEWLLTKPRFGILPGENHYFESHDGTLLHAALWLPDAPEEQVPLILVMSPYLGTGTRMSDLDPASLPRGGFNRWLLEHFVPRGYAVALEDVRGTGDSGGCLEQTGWKQQMDGYVSVEYFAAQPWSSGKVGMAGISYLGETQQGTAIHAPPHLVTIVPAASISDGYRWWFYDAVPYWDPWIGGMWGYMMDDGLQPPASREGLRAYLTRPGCHPENVQEAAGDGTHDTYWDQRNLRPHAGNVQASVFYVHGLQDWNVKPDHILHWFNEIQAPKMAWLGQWEHNYPWRNTHKPEWSRADWNVTLQRWFDHWLLGVENGVLELPRVQVQDSAGQWRAERDWPPLDAEPFVLHLAGDGTLRSGPPAEERSLSYDEQEGRAARRFAENAPLNFWPVPGWVPGAGAAFVPLSAAGMAAEHLPPYELPDGLRFVGEPLERGLRLAGAPEVRLTIASTEPETHLAVHLLSIDPEGNASILDRGYLSAEHRVELSRVDPVPPGQAIPLTVTMYPQDTVIPAGHQLALWVGPWDDWARPEGNGARVELLLGGENEAFLSIPVVERDLARVGLPVPMYDWSKP